MISKNHTSSEYKDIIVVCKKLFAKKSHDYGAAWCVLRLPSITDQVLIKAQRIRNIQEKGLQKIQDNIKDEFIGIVNYCVMALIRIRLGDAMETNSTFDQLESDYDQSVEEAFRLQQDKNHDYDEAWRGMRVSSITDIILMKLLRVKQIENNAGKTLASEGVKANYQDMLNYAVFALIKLKES